MDNFDDSIFQVSIKGLFLNEENKLLMIQEKNGLWEVPGGRIQKGETFIECLKREVNEETGLTVEVLEEQPFLIYPAIDKKSRARIMIFFKVKFNNFRFTPSDECVDLKFFSTEEIKNLETYPQLKALPDLLTHKLL